MLDYITSRLKLVPNWRDVLRYAATIKLFLLAGVFSGAEMALPFIDQFISIPRGVFAALTFVTSCCGLVARLVAQQSLQPRDPNTGEEQWPD